MCFYIDTRIQLLLNIFWTEALGRALGQWCLSWAEGRGRPLDFSSERRRSKPRSIAWTRNVKCLEWGLFLSDEFLGKRCVECVTYLLVLFLFVFLFLVFYVFVYLFVDLCTIVCFWFICLYWFTFAVYLFTYFCLSVCLPTYLGIHSFTHLRIHSFIRFHLFFFRRIQDSPLRFDKVNVYSQQRLINNLFMLFKVILKKEKKKTKEI